MREKDLFLEKYTNMGKSKKIMLFILIIIGIAIAVIYFLYANRFIGYRKFISPDGKTVLYINQCIDDDGRKVDEIEMSVEGDLSNSSLLFQDKILEINWTKDSKRYAISSQKDGTEFVTVMDIFTGNHTDVYQRIKEKIPSMVNENSSEYGYSVKEYNSLSLDFVEWCDNNSSMILKYNILDTYKTKRTGYTIYNIDSDTIESFYTY